MKPHRQMRRQIAKAVKVLRPALRTADTDTDGLTVTVREVVRARVTPSAAGTSRGTLSAAASTSAAFAAPRHGPLSEIAFASISATMIDAPVGTPSRSYRFGRTSTSIGSGYVKAGWLGSSPSTGPPTR